VVQTTNNLSDDNTKTRTAQTKTKVVRKSQVEVTALPSESAESLLRRFNREVVRSGIMKRLKELEFYEKPSKRRRKEDILKKYRASFDKDGDHHEEV